ncbi:MAG TPA: hypothetical protein VFJ91_08345 [Gaiellaceae bacterium]|nr:hypothetical protein [Gaiellaceae bacterium]
MPGWLGPGELLVLVLAIGFLFAFLVGAVALGVRIATRPRRPPSHFRDGV